VLTGPQLLKKMTINPARVLGLDRGTRKPGVAADVMVIDPKVEWTIDPSPFRSPASSRSSGEFFRSRLGSRC
jgi:dihydroorotase